MKDLEARYLERLSQLYPTIAKASTEIIFAKRDGTFSYGYPWGI